MPSKKRAKGEQDNEVMLNDIEASQWNESRMYAIVQSLDTELQEIVQRLGSCLTQEIHPEHWEEFRERVRDLLDTFTEDLEDVLQGTTADDEERHSPKPSIWRGDHYEAPEADRAAADYQRPA